MSVHWKRILLICACLAGASMAAEPGLDLSVKNPVIPVLKRKLLNPVMAFTIRWAGDETPLLLEEIGLSLEGSSDLKDIKRIDLLSANADEVIGGSEMIANSMALKLDRRLEAGESTFWISVTLHESADIDGRIGISLKQVTVSGKAMSPDPTTSTVRQRMGIGLRLRGDDGSNSYRIPGLVRTKAGSLLAAYDVRYKGCGDLPGEIDIGVSRSVDGGKHWEEMRIAMHAGTMGAEYEADGCGDPAILVDQASGRIWMAGLWSHGNRAWARSGPGIRPDETGQLLLIYSDDDGRTWSPPRNITASIKDPAWRLLFNGPGAGICMKDGTLVFPAQFRAADGGETKGKPFSTIITSKDRGETWSIGSGARIDTTEAQVVELHDGSLMLNCRDDRGGSRTVMVTKDLGKNWTPHATDRGALREPVCMASLLRWDHPEQGDLFLFSNPDSSKQRHHLTLKISKDHAASWPERWQELYDSRGGAGYSCLAPADEEHVGVIFEGPCELYFMRLPLDEILK